FMVDGIGEKIPIEILKPDERKKAIEAAWHVSRREKTPEIEKRMDLTIAIRAKRQFPPLSEVTLFWGKGVSAVKPLHKSILSSFWSLFLSDEGSKLPVSTAADQKLVFKVREPFTAKARCERENAKSDCIPLKNIEVHFTSQVPWEQAKNLTLILQNGKKVPPIEPGFMNQMATGYVAFEAPFPPESIAKIEVPGDLADESGRKLTNRDIFPLELKIGGYPPLAKFAADFGVLEFMKGQTALPVTLRNIEPELKARLGIHEVSGEGLKDALTGRALMLEHPDMRAISALISKAGMERNKSSILSADSVKGMPGSKIRQYTIKRENGREAFEVIGIPLDRTGFYVVEIESRILGKSLFGDDKPFYVRSAVLVTGLAVHLKKGVQSSLVMVTRLSDAVPVDGASIKLVDCRGRILASGKSNRDGLFKTGELPSEIPQCYNDSGYDQYSSGIFAVARKGDDFSFTHSSWSKGIESWRYQLPVSYMPSRDVARTVFDRTLLKASDKLNMKHFIRRHSSSGFSAIPKDELPDTVEILHPGSMQKYELPLKWLPNFSAHTVWTIPPSARLGEYDVSLVLKKKGKLPDNDPSHAGIDSNKAPLEKRYESGRFFVEEFKVPLMKGNITPEAQNQIAVESMNLLLSLGYLAGGPAQSAAVQVRYRQIPDRGGGHHFNRLDNFEDFYFLHGSALEGEKAEDQSPEDENRDDRGWHKQAVTLDRNGFAKVTVDKIRKQEIKSSLSVEMEFTDPNGEIQTVYKSVPIYPSEYVIGIKPETRYASIKKKVKVSFAVIDLDGNPVAGADIDSVLYE
ncbi:MAG: hypothetical protein HQK54_16555, partial [Oligoflexales bacterium]|nr:hypothetical protein [Oligoflexales bacterium]